MKLKSAFSFLASLALAAVVVFASSTCSAAILIKPRTTGSSPSGDIVGGVVLRWNKYKGAKSYAIYRSRNKKNIKYAKVLKRTVKGTEYWDFSAKLACRYYYWVVPNVKNSTKNLYSSSQAKKSFECSPYCWYKFTYDGPKKSNKVRKGKKLYLGFLFYDVDGDDKYGTLAKYGVKWSVKYSGVHKFYKKSGKKGLLGYFTSKKKGKGYYTLKIGDYTVIKKRKIIWK
ncbi:MAG: hypothetical protein IJG84_08005 [Kiritimatiellae bacterium]|nr:hypothetical protein [Kiritimatiellia bacterium]